MHWDRKLGILTAAALCLIVLTAAGVVWWITIGSQSSGARIAGHAEDGYAELCRRLEDLDNVGHVMIARRGKYETQSRYSDFDEAWLQELVITGHEFVEDEIAYQHTIRFLLRTYDTENVYLPDDTRKIYGRYTDEAMMFKNKDQYYVIYRSGKTEYRFIAECPPLTEWLEEKSK